MGVLELILTDYTLQIVSLGSMILGITSGVIGSFAVVRKESLLGDAVSHAALPGIAIAFILTQTKSSELLLLGAFISGLIATYLVYSIVKNSRIKFDSALALILSVFFGFGMVLLTYIQKTPNANQAGLESFIFGQASSLLKKDVQIMAVMGLILIILVVVFWKEFKLVSFDLEFAQTLGFSTNKITMILFVMMVTTIVLGLQTVGVILMSAMLTSPGVAARQWTDKMSVMVILSAIFGAISGFVGTLLSSIIPRMPTGPIIVIVLSAIVLLSISFAPKRGLIWRQIRNRKNQRDINIDQILINLYNLALNHENIEHSHDLFIIEPQKGQTKKSRRELKNTLENLCQRGLVRRDYFDKWAITDQGIEHVEKNFVKEEA